MAEIIYRPQVRCEVSEGLTGKDITVCIVDIRGMDQYIHVLPTMVNWEGDVPYLPVGIINIDRGNRRVLVELPIEADSGANRMWMPFEKFRVATGAPA